MYWLKSQTGEFLDDGKLVNLIHYNDAARAVVSAIERGDNAAIVLVFNKFYWILFDRETK